MPHITQPHEGATDKRLTQRQQNLIALEMLWRDLLPWAELPCKLHLCSWLSATQNNIDLITDAIQQASERDDVLNPENWIWSVLRKYDTRHTSRYASQRYRRVDPSHSQVQ